LPKGCWLLSEVQLNAQLRQETMVEVQTEKWRMKNIGEKRRAEDLEEAKVN